MVPEAGRVTVTGDPAISQFPWVSGPRKATLSGADSAAVVGSGTSKVIAPAVGCAAVSAMAPTEVSSGMITNGTGFDSTRVGARLSIWMVSVPGVWTSERLSAVAQEVVLEQDVARGVPLIKMLEAVRPVPATKLAPCTTSGKLSTAPAKTLEGSRTSMTGPLVRATVAAANLVVSATLVARTAMALGVGALLGAE